MTRTLFLLAQTVAMLQVACGTSESQPSPAATDTSVLVPTDTPDVASDVPAKPDLPPKADVGPGPAPKSNALRVSYISADSYAGQGGANATVIAGFYDEVPSGLSSTSEQIGPCVVRTTTFGDGKFKLEKHSVGTITLSGGLEVVTLKPGPGGDYPAFQGKAALWKGGEALIFDTTGGDIPGFSATVAAPSHVRITAPVLPLGKALPVPRTADLAVGWTGDSTGQVVFHLSGPQQLPAPQTTLSCYFTPADAKGTIPKEALAKIALTGTGTVSAMSLSAAEPKAGLWEAVTIQAAARALRQSDTPWLGTVEIQ